MDDRAVLARSSGDSVRQAAREGHWTQATHGLARGYVQANLAIVPERYAFDFMRFCQRNPKPCPLIDVTDPGNPEPRQAAPGSDLRTDLPGYNIYREGKLVEEVRSLSEHWRADHVAFLLGCSNSFDEIMLDAGIPQRHLEQEGGRLSVYISTIPCTPAGPFVGPMVVTMRPIERCHLVRSIEIAARFPIAHGAPVHIGDPAAIGIDDLEQVRWGKFNRPGPEDEMVFWACGVTPQAIAMRCGVPEMITHAPGHMFVTDLRIANAAQPL